MPNKTNSELELEALANATTSNASSKSNFWKSLETKFKVRFSPIQEIPIGVLKENPDNLYPPLTGVEFEDLVADIKKMGVVVPLIVRKDNVVISGHNRLRASKKTGLKVLPCIVLIEPETPNPQLISEIEISENERRRSWTYEQKKEFIKKNFSKAIQQDKRGGDRKSKNQKLEKTFDSVEAEIHKKSGGNISVSVAKTIRAELNKEKQGKKQKKKYAILAPIPPSFKTSFSSFVKNAKKLDLQERKVLSKHLKRLAKELTAK